MIKYNLKELVSQKSFKEGSSITMTDVAKAINISRNTLYRMANSKGDFSTKTEYIEKLCTYFNCTPNDLMTIVSDKSDGGEQGEGEEVT